MAAAAAPRHLIKAAGTHLCGGGQQQQEGVEEGVAEAGCPPGAARGVTRHRSHCHSHTRGHRDARSYLNIVPQGHT